MRKLKSLLFGLLTCVFACFAKTLFKFQHISELYELCIDVTAIAVICGACALLSALVTVHTFIVNRNICI